MNAVLVATLGAEPQVVTLTLDALLLKGYEIVRVVIVHTSDDDQPIRFSLDRLRREFVARRYYGDRLVFIPHLLAGSSGPLPDVASSNQISIAFQSFYTLLRQLKQAGFIIHLSISGGRKTMALFAMAAAQIVFDADDRLWHIVSDVELIHSRALHADHPEQVDLVDVPIAHLDHWRVQHLDQTQYFIENILSAAEREVVLVLLVEGASNAAIARKLGKSPKTVANQLSSAYRKFGDFFALSTTPDRVLLLAYLGRYS